MHGVAGQSGPSRPPRNWRRRNSEYGELRCEKPIIDYFRSERFFVGCGENESALCYVIDRIGPQGCVHGSNLLVDGFYFFHATESWSLFHII
jgi:hypothetical protein